MARAYMILIAVCVLFAGEAVAGHKVVIHNMWQQSYQVWFWPRGSTRWLRPPLYLRKLESKKADLDASDPYYVVLRDDAQRDTHLGWIDLKTASQANPGYDIIIEELSEEKEIPYNVTVCSPETRTRTIDGKPYTYTVNVPHTETRTAKILVKTPRVRLMSPSGETIDVPSKLDSPPRSPSM